MIAHLTAPRARIIARIIPRIIPLALLFTASALLAGREGWGRLALRLHQPSLAAALLTDPVARGIALLQSGHAAEAEALFIAAGQDATYDRAAALAALGRYDLSRAFYDAVLFVDRHDQDAIYNRAVINRLIPPLEVPPGEENASLAPPVMQDLGVRTGADHDLGRALAQRDRRVARPVTAIAMQASESWLVTLSDSPGEYLSKLLAAEHERRALAGLIRP